MQQSAQNVQPRRNKAPAQRKRPFAESDVRSTCVSSEGIRVVPEGQRRVPGGILCAGRTHNFDTPYLGQRSALAWADSMLCKCRGAKSFGSCLSCAID